MLRPKKSSLNTGAPEMRVTIIGTGDFGRALGARLITSNYQVTFGSRSPRQRDLAVINKALAYAPVMSISDSIRENDVIFLCMNMEAHHSLRQYQHLLIGKIVVDVSNLPDKPRNKSNAEQLAAMFPGTHVVKAFNTVSAYSLESEAAGGGKQVHICGDDPHSRERVRCIASNMGFSAVDCGGLQYAITLEAMPHTLFRSWRRPSFALLIVFAFWCIYGCTRYLYLKEKPYTKERLPTNIMNKVFGCVGLTMLALCYLPGVLAGFTQLINCTKYKRFPDWLDHWMKMRKQLGLYALLFSCMHVMMSLTLIRAPYYASWFLAKNTEVNLTQTGVVEIPVDSRMSWVGETCVLLGVLAITTMCILGITSLPSVGSTLSWKEWNFVQSYLGWACLLLGLAHVGVMGLGGSWLGQPMFLVVQKLSFLVTLLPSATVFFKILLLLPCCYCRLSSIRNGKDYRSKGLPTDDVEVEVIQSSHVNVYDVMAEQKPEAANRLSHTSSIIREMDHNQGRRM